MSEEKSLIQQASDLFMQQWTMHHEIITDDMPATGERLNIPVLPPEEQPMSEQKHDGKLGGSGYEEATVEYYNAHYRPEGRAIYIGGGYGDMESSGITLDVKQALSLLVWLTENRNVLEQLAKEQEP